VSQLLAPANPHPAGTGYQGLTPAEAQARIEKYGPNILPRRPPIPVWRQLLAQLVHFFAVMLWIAGLLAILAGVLQLGFAIFVVILLNGLFAFFQEYRAEHTSDRLRDLLPRRATVLRDRLPVEVNASGLVPDDVVMLKAGDRISADLRTPQHSLLWEWVKWRMRLLVVARPYGPALWVGVQIGSFCSLLALSYLCSWVFSMSRRLLRFSGMHRRALQDLPSQA
jgi:Cation transporter/ATPase, N-terminus/E1-E2 ATPase